MLFLFIQHTTKKTSPFIGQHCRTILLHTKNDPLLPSYYIPIALANTIYKLYTNTLRTLFTSYNKKHKLLHFSHEDFRPQRNAIKQIQMSLATLEDVCPPYSDIYLMYIDFINALHSIDHTQSLAAIEDLDYPQNTVELIGN
jgi:hypothetical protein